MPPIPLPLAILAQPPLLHPVQQYEVILSLGPVLASKLAALDGTASIFLQPQQDPTILTITPTQVLLDLRRYPQTEPPPAAAKIKARQAPIPTTITLPPTLTPTPAPTLARNVAQAPPPTVTVAQPQPPPYIPHHSLSIGSLIAIILGSLAGLLLLLSLLRYLAYRRRRQSQTTQPPLPSCYREEDYYKYSPRRSPSPYRHHHHRRHHRRKHRRDEARGRRSSKMSYDYAEVPVMRTVLVVHTRTVPTTTTNTRTIPVQQATTTETRPGDMRGPTNVYYR